jgi:TolB-like protein
VLLYEIKAGELPFTGQTDFDLAAAILDRPPRALPATTPAAVCDVLQRCLVKSPDDRYRSAVEIRNALAGAYVHAGYGLPPGGRHPSGEPGRSPADATGMRRVRRRTLLSLAPILIVAVVFAWWAVVRRGPLAPHAAGSPPMLAVLPFHLEGVGSNDDYLAVGIADGIITRLASVRSLRVRPTVAVARYQQSTPDSATVARDVGATHAVYITGRHVGSRYEMGLQIVRTDEGSVVGAGAFESSSLVDVEEQIARRVVRAFNLGLSEGERASLARQNTENAAAYEEYLKGRTALVQMGESAVQAAIAAFEKALQLDPGYAPAQAGLAMALVRRPW